MKGVFSGDAVCVYDIVLRGEVVYVGITNNPEYRLKDHRATGKAPEGSAMSVLRWFESRKSGMKAEKERQLELTPIYCRDLEHGIKPPKPEFDWVAYRKKLAELTNALTQQDIDNFMESIQ